MDIGILLIIFGLALALWSGMSELGRKLKEIKKTLDELRKILKKGDF